MWLKCPSPLWYSRKTISEKKQFQDKKQFQPVTVTEKQFQVGTGTVFQLRFRSKSELELFFSYRLRSKLELELKNSYGFRSKL